MNTKPVLRIHKPIKFFIFYSIIAMYIPACEQFLKTSYVGLRNNPLKQLDVKFEVKGNG